MAVEALAEEGFEVLEAETGEKALQLWHEQAADLVFTDIRLGGELTGWDVAERCRDSHPLVAVIYATGYSNVTARPVSGSLLFQKPYGPDQIVEAIYSLTR